PFSSRGLSTLGISDVTRSIRSVLEGRSRWAVELGDCLEILPTLPDKSVAHAICDPPYRRGLYLNFRTNAFREGSRKGSKGNYQALSNLAIGAAEDVARPCVKQFLRICSR